MSDNAIRHPKRGKAHRESVYGWFDYTVCGRPTRPMTESIPVEQTAPEDRCRKCWPTTTHPDHRAERGESEEQ